MALNNIYTGRLQGSAVLIGNTNCLTSATSPSDTTSNVYTTTIPTLQVAGYPPGTTLTQSQNSSTAILNMPAGSSITFAYHTWMIAYESAVAPISFIIPTSNNAVSGTIIQTAGTNTWRAAYVTSIVAAAGADSYTVANFHDNLITTRDVRFHTALYYL